MEIVSPSSSSSLVSSSPSVTSRRRRRLVMNSSCSAKISRHRHCRGSNGHSRRANHFGWPCAFRFHGTHVFRHGASQDAFEEGGLELVMLRTGHLSASSAQHYARSDLERHQQVLKTQKKNIPAPQIIKMVLEATKTRVTEAIRVQSADSIPRFATSRPHLTHVVEEAARILQQTLAQRSKATSSTPLSSSASTTRTATVVPTVPTQTLPQRRERDQDVINTNNNSNINNNTSNTNCNLATVSASDYKTVTIQFFDGRVQNVLVLKKFTAIAPFLLESEFKRVYTRLMNAEYGAGHW